MQRCRKIIAATPMKMKKREITKAIIRACKRRERNFGFDFVGVSGEESSPENGRL